MNFAISIRDIIFRARRSMEAQGLTPKELWTSTDAYEALLAEVNRADKKNHKAIFDIYGMTIKQDPSCPSRGAYIVAEEINGEEFEKAKASEAKKIGGKEHG